MVWVGPSYGLKFFTNGSISDRLHKLNSDIPVFRHVVTILPRASPMRIGYIQALASALNVHYNLLSQVDDLEQSILHYTEAIFLPPRWDRHSSNLAQNFLSTAQLLLRAARTKQPEDVERPVVYLRYLHGFNTLPVMVKASLVCVLAMQVKSEQVGDVMRDIEESPRAS